MVVSHIEEILNLDVVFNRYWKCPIIQWWVTINRNNKLVSIIALVTLLSCCVCSYKQNSDFFVGM